MVLIEAAAVAAAVVVVEGEVVVVDFVELRGLII